MLDDLEHKGPFAYVSLLYHDQEVAIRRHMQVHTSTVHELSLIEVSDYIWVGRVYRQ